MESTADGLLFFALVNELRLPLLQIARLSEQETPDSANHIGLISEHALRLVDAYSQAVSTQQLALEPVNIRSVLYDAAHVIAPYAQAADFVVEVDQQGNNTPILAHRNSLQAMLTLVATSLIHNPFDDNQEKRLVLASHALPGGRVVGAFSNQTVLSSRAVTAMRQLHGRAQQATPELGQTGTASLAIADRLANTMTAPLHAYRHSNLSGIGSLLTPSRQLHFTV